MLSTIHTLIRRVPIWSVYLLLMVPSVYYFYLAATGMLSVEPIKALEHKLGEFGLQLIVFGLAVTPLRRHLGLNLMRFRRVIGVMSYFYITVHLLVWLVLDVQVLSMIWQDIVKRPYISIGMLAFVAMTPLALSSNTYAVRKLGPLWCRLHKLVYGIAILGALHFIMLVKGFQLEPFVYMGLIMLLLALRLKLPKSALSRSV